MITINRYPPTDDRSLKAWSSADELMLSEGKEMIQANTVVVIYNDRFGYVTAYCDAQNKIVVTTHKSQEDAIKYNHKDNQLSPISKFVHPLETLPEPPDVVYIKVPKSMDLFRLFLAQIHQSSKSKTTVLCGFMTKYFTKQMVEIAEEYFADVSQGLAWKKARVMKLSSPKAQTTTPIQHLIPYTRPTGQSISLYQYYGVFSAKRIDYATQFLLEHLTLDANVQRVLDLASGNGIIAHEVLALKPDIEMHLMDDAILAIESSKLNLKESNAEYHYDYVLDELPADYFDLVVCNPPFHFEHENTIDIALSLFRGAADVLHEEGRFVCVANVHLNYKTHLGKIFTQVDVMAMNEKFIVYECWR